MNVLVLAPYVYDTAPCQRFRIEQWMPLLERQGVRFDFDAFTSAALHDVLYRPVSPVRKAWHVLGDYLRRLARSLRARRYDVVFLHREAAIIGPAWIERLVAWSGVPIVYEFDDAIFVPYVSPSNRYLSYLKFPQKTGSICRVSSQVIVGNELLRDYAARYNPNVTIVPTTIDTDRYQPAARYDIDGDAVIGWTGSYSSIQYLESLAPALRKLVARHKLRLQVVSAGPYKMDGVPVDTTLWKAASEAEDLHPMHIGVMPLVDDVWTRGKCACKALQYMAIGIPTVVSPVGVNSDVIRDGENGFLAATTDEWVDKLERLIASRELRQKLGQAGRETVEAQYSARVQAPRVLAVLERAAAGR